MKKYLPLILLGLGVIVVLFVVILSIKNKNKKVLVEPEEEETFVELPIDKKPVVSLTPTLDGHYLKLIVEKITINNARSMDYELLYTLPSGITQGVPGTADVTGLNKFEADLLLGSESSGKFRYDNGIESGTISLWYRDEKGKLITKMSSDFRMFTGVSEISSSDEKLKLVLEPKPKKGYFIVMDTLGIPDKYEFDISQITAGPYGVFSSEYNIKSKILNNQGMVFGYSDGAWSENPSELGIFVLL